MQDKSENMTSARINQCFRNEITEEIFHTEADVINMTGPEFNYKHFLDTAE